MNTQWSQSYQKRKKIIDVIFRSLFKLAGIVAASMIIFIFIFIFQKGISVFLPSYGPDQVNFWEFMTGFLWRSDQKIYGVLFIVINTIVTAFLAMLIAFPISVLTALFIVKIAPKPLDKIFITVIELLAAIPSVVYGVFASGIIVGWVDNVAQLFGYSTFGGRSMLAVVILLAIMVIPTMTSLSIVAIKAVKPELELGSLALGASKTQTNFKVVLTSAKSGIFAGLILGLARAFGEATAVSMVAGNKPMGPTWNPFDITRTLTSTMLSGLKETTGVDYDIRFSVGIVLMITILISNLVIHRIKKKVGAEGQ
ncbi:phosphate ABC transporter permease subunit PstC [Erysipelothrix sp. HDW6C]|uniref:phosphate ABC transporter permease subunit PstC n=1 Tax=Erysipelothrix sp. HDW6C TaxID=2714930 RepID=UPI00140A0747|nr:phosphate ABC transporter permease subunit PstC [Erysipelothrix sp. HDW6C]QIK70173.1 phosphate ABC transporter permease subunit PstC [Erysipelothrix sp. HDW6C]